MRPYLALTLLAALWASPAASEAYYYRLGPSLSPAQTDPDKSGNGTPGTPSAPGIAASGAPTGYTTVGDGVNVRFSPTGLGLTPTFARTGADIPGLVLSSDGVLSGSLTVPGKQVYSVQATGDGKTATSSVTFDTRWYPPQVDLPAPAGPVFRGVPFTIQASATNGASVVNWAVGAGLSGTVDKAGLLRVTAPVGQTGDGSVTVTGTDAWDQSGSATRAIAFSTPTASLALPARMRGGLTYTFPLTTNLPSPSWSYSGLTTGSISLSANSASLTLPAVSYQTGYGVNVRASSGEASATASASSTIVPPLVLASQPASVLARRASGQLSYDPPSVTGRLGTLAYTLTKGAVDISDTMPTDCPGFSFSRQTGVISGQPSQSSCNATYAYTITDPGDGTAPSSAVSTGAFAFQTQSNPSFATQPPPTLTVVQGASGTVTVALAQDGGYVSPLQFWRVTNGSDSADAKPSWFNLSCPTTSATCTVTVSPTTSVAAGTYGPYAVMAGDGTGYYKASGTFTIQVATAAFYIPSVEGNLSVSVGTTYQTRPTVNRTSASTSISGTVQWSIVGDDGTSAGVPAWLTKGTSANDSASGYSFFNAAPPAGTAVGTYPTSGGSYRIKAVDGSGFAAYSSPFIVTVYPKASVTDARPVSAVYGGGPVSFTQLCTNCTSTSVDALWNGTASLRLSIDAAAKSVDVVQYDFGKEVFIGSYWMLSNPTGTRNQFALDFWNGREWVQFIALRGNYDSPGGIQNGLTARYLRVRLTQFIDYPWTANAGKLKFGDANAVFAP